MSEPGHFYGLLFGENPQAKVVLAALGLAEDDIERYRDAEVCEIPERDEFGYENADAGTYLRVTTRTGGDNRRYNHNDKLSHHPLFEWTEDDEDDSTYAYFYFRMPEQPAAGVTPGAGQQGE